MEFQYQMLRAQTNHNRDLVAGWVSDLAGSGKLWAALTPLFGAASNEVIVITNERVGELSETVASEVWIPTVRPTSRTPLERPGLYVLRRFVIEPDDVDEVVELSNQAWETFENTSEYEAEPMGLFDPGAGEDGLVSLALVTWYDGFSSWETSRRPSEEARDNFARRFALTRSSSAIAARLVEI